MERVLKGSARGKAIYSRLIEGQTSALRQVAHLFQSAYGVHNKRVTGIAAAGDVWCYSVFFREDTDVGNVVIGSDPEYKQSEEDESDSEDEDSDSEDQPPIDVDAPQNVTTSGADQLGIITPDPNPVYLRLLLGTPILPLKPWERLTVTASIWAHITRARRLSSPIQRKLSLAFLDLSL